MANGRLPTSTARRLFFRPCQGSHGMGIFTDLFGCLGVMLLARINVVALALAFKGPEYRGRLDGATCLTPHLCTEGTHNWTV